MATGFTDCRSIVEVFAAFPHPSFQSLLQKRLKIHLPPGEGFFAQIVVWVHNLFTDSSIFPLAFFSVLGYYVLALKE